MRPASSHELGAILLAGGRATRLDGAVKPLLDVGGRTLLGAAVDAARNAGAEPITVVSEVLDATLPVTWVREDPPFGGPVAALVAAFASWPREAAPEWTLLLACDLPLAGPAVELLMSDVPQTRDEDGVCLVDRTGRAQWLTGVFRTSTLRAAASGLPSRGRDLPMRAVVGGLTVRRVAAADDLIQDVDTWEDLREARRRLDTPHAPSKESP